MKYPIVEVTQVAQCTIAKDPAGLCHWVTLIKSADHVLIFRAEMRTKAMAEQLAHIALGMRRDVLAFVQPPGGAVYEVTA